MDFDTTKIVPEEASFQEQFFFEAGTMTSPARRSTYNCFMRLSDESVKQNGIERHHGYSLFAYRWKGILFILHCHMTFRRFKILVLFSAEERILAQHVRKKRKLTEWRLLPCHIWLGIPRRMYDSCYQRMQQLSPFRVIVCTLTLHSENIPRNDSCLASVCGAGYSRLALRFSNLTLNLLSECVWCTPALTEIQCKTFNFN